MWAIKVTEKAQSFFVSPGPHFSCCRHVAAMSLFAWVILGREFVMGKKLLLMMLLVGTAQVGMAGVITFDSLSNNGMLAGGYGYYSENADDPAIIWANFNVDGDPGDRFVENGLSMSTFQTGSTFDFYAADFRGDPANVIPETSIMVSGHRQVGGDVVGFSTVIDGLTTTFDNRILNLTNLLSLTLTPGDGGYFNMDNVALYQGGQSPFAAVPVPSAIFLGGIGTICVGWLRRRRAV